MKKTVLYPWLVLLLITSADASPDTVPDATLRVTVQQKADGKTLDGFLFLELSCRNGECSLSSVLLNQCGETAYGKQAFFPKLQYSSTSIGNLKARNEGTSIVVQETGSDLAGNYVINLRFDYGPAREDRAITRLTGFSGGYARNSSILNKVFTIEYAPLPKVFQVMKLDCGVLLPGIDKK